MKRLNFHPEDYLGKSKKICCPVCQSKAYETVGDRIEEGGVACNWDLYNAVCKTCGNEFMLICEENKLEPYMVIQKGVGAPHISTAKTPEGEAKVKREIYNDPDHGLVPDYSRDFKWNLERKRAAFKKKQAEERKSKGKSCKIKSSAQKPTCHGASCRCASCAAKRKKTAQNRTAKK